MKNFLSKIGSIIQENTKDPYKSVAHFIRSGATSIIMMVTAGFFLAPFFRYFGMAVNYSLVDELIILAIAIIALYVSKLFIKEWGRLSE